MTPSTHEKLSLMRRKQALIFALAVGGLALALSLMYMRRFEREMSGGERIVILALMRDVPPGTALTEDMLAARSVPIAYLDSRAVLERDKEKVIGLDTTIGLDAQQTLQWTDLDVVTDRKELSSLIRAGKRAMTVRARETASNKLINPGDYVDVIATTGAGAERKSMLLLQRMLVLAVGTQLEATQDGGAKKSSRGESVLTLSLSVEEAQLLALATEQGDLTVAVRNPDDQRIYDDLPDMKSSALVEARDQLRDRRRATPASAPKGPIKL